jgi:hypothetical protein
MLRGVNGAGGGAPVGGTGTANTIPRWTGVSTLGDSIITQTAQGAVVTGPTNGLLPISGSTPTNAAFLIRGPLTNALFFGASNASPFGTWLQSTDAAVLGNWYPLLLNPNGGNVGIGTPSPISTAKLTLGGAANSTIKMSYQTGGTTEVAFDQMNTATGEFRHSSGVSSGWGGFHTFYTDTTEKVRISSTAIDASLVSGYGLKLPATNGTTYNTDPNTLDCYAEKDLTATMTCGTSGTITLSASTLKFTRVGRVVHVSGRLVINSVSSPLGRLQVDIGLGANERPSVYTSSTVWLNAWAAGFTQTPFGFIAPGGTILYVDRWGAGSMNIDAAQYAQANAEMMISLTYIV